jgi:CHAD domain-containing protein
VLPDGVNAIQTTMSMAEMLRLIWREQYMQMLLLEGGVRRDDDIEYVHKMRVAIRRMRTAYLLLKEYFQAETVDPLINDLKKSAKVLGKVRDLDVALEKLARYGKRLDRDAQQELQPLFQHWQQERTERFHQLIGWFDGKSYRELLIALRQFVETPGQGVRTRFTQLRQPPEAIQIRHVLPAMIVDRFLAVRKYEALFDTLAADQADAQKERIPVKTLHALRIECKYLRYTLEFVPDLLGEDGQDVVKQLKKLQDQLGDMNDASVAKEMLLSLPKAVRTPSVKRYVKRQNRVMRKTQEQVEHALRNFLSDQDRERLGRMIARV